MGLGGGKPGTKNTTFVEESFGRSVESKESITQGESMGKQLVAEMTSLGEQGRSLED